MSTTEKLPRWYFGGVASAMAVFFTHPLDLIKVQLQTQTGKKVPLVPLAVDLVKRNGVIVGLYSGLSASVFRQLTYSTIRFGIYDTAKIFLGKDMGLVEKILVAFVAGGLGGYVGTPPDKVNVRMQNDVRLPPEKRLNYKHVFDGFAQVYQKEGFSKLFAGSGAASMRAGFMAIGQLVSYDQLKILCLQSGKFEDNLLTHMTCSIGAAGIATTITQPLDTIKTRIMNAKVGEFKNAGEVILHTAKEGPMAFFKGYVPAFLRIGPQTILTFLIYERLRMYFGYVPEKSDK